MISIWTWCASLGEAILGALEIPNAPEFIDGLVGLAVFSLVVAFAFGKAKKLFRG